MTKSIRKIAAMFFCFCCCFFLFFKLFIIDGNSMLNTYKSGQIFYAAKLFPVHVGDVVVASVFDEEEGRNINVIKRVIAKGGDSVAIIGGKIIINGQPYFDEFTRQDDFIYSLAPQLLEEDQVFIIGDNRSITQHYIISREQIIGKSLF